MIDKLKNYIRHPSKILLFFAARNIIPMSDEKYLKMQYYSIFNKKLNLEEPKTFNEKLQWLKLHDRNPEYTKMVDKYEAKKYVSSKIGEEYIIPTLGLYDKFDDIDFDQLPKEFVIKCTHDSGGVVICKDKTTFNKKQARKKINKCLKRNFYYLGREWPYKNVKPKIIIEKYIIDDSKKELMDYKLMCFNGQVKCSFVCSERSNGLKVDFYDLNWNKMPFIRHYPNSKHNIQRPINYNKMIEIAQKLSKDIPFVRIDFYEVNKMLYFGEFTFYPGGGYEEFTPDEYDYTLGELIDININK